MEATLLQRALASRPDLQWLQRLSGSKHDVSTLDGAAAKQEFHLPEAVMKKVDSVGGQQSHVTTLQMVLGGGSLPTAVRRYRRCTVWEAALVYHLRERKPVVRLDQVVKTARSVCQTTQEDFLPGEYRAGVETWDQALIHVRWHKLLPFLQACSVDICTRANGGSCMHTRHKFAKGEVRFICKAGPGQTTYLSLPAAAWLLKPLLERANADAGVHIKPQDVKGLQSLPAEARRVFAEAFKVNAAEMATFNGAHAAPNSVQQAPKRGYVARSAAAPRAQPAAAARQPSAGVDKNKTWDPLLLKMVQMSEASGLSTAAAYEALINDLGRWAQASKLYSKAVRTMWPRVDELAAQAGLYAQLPAGMMDRQLDYLLANPASMRQAELVDACRVMGLKVSGIKADLQQRLLGSLGLTEPSGVPGRLLYWLNMRKRPAASAAAARRTAGPSRKRADRSGAYLVLPDGSLGFLDALQEAYEASFEW